MEVKGWGPATSTSNQVFGLGQPPLHCLGLDMLESNFVQNLSDEDSMTRVIYIYDRVPFWRVNLVLGLEYL